MFYLRMVHKVFLWLGGGEYFEENKLSYVSRAKSLLFTPILQLTKTRGTSVQTSLAKHRH